MTDSVIKSLETVGWPEASIEHGSTSSQETPRRLDVAEKMRALWS